MYHVPLRSLSFYSEDGDSRFLRNASTCMNYTASQRITRQQLFLTKGGPKVPVHLCERIGKIPIPTHFRKLGLKFLQPCTLCTLHCTLHQTITYFFRKEHCDISLSLYRLTHPHSCFNTHSSGLPDTMDLCVQVLRFARVQSVGT